ncbi:MAG: aspartate aminotransferase family protein [Elusimicrobiota bacterium]
MKNKTKNPYLEKELEVFMHTFKRQPLLIKKAKGSWVWDESGKKYLDFYSGIAVCGVGHSNKNIVNAIKKQAELLIHSSNFFYTQPQFKYAQELTRKWKNSKVFFSNTGAEANELCIKLARLWATKENKKGREIITFQNAFHGRTIATSTASWGKTRSNSVYEPLLEGFKSVPYNDLTALTNAINENTIAVMMEPVQGEGGINIASETFLEGTDKLCKENNLLLILDEVQSGMGRTGTFFSFEQYHVQPDIVSLAKGIAGGLPLGATLAAPRVSKYMEPGLHGSTFGGNPVSCASALEVLKILSSRGLVGIQKTASLIKDKLSEFQTHPKVQAIRQKGLMIGIELKVPGDPYVSMAREKGLLINCTQGNVLRFLPSYTINKKEINLAFKILSLVFKEMERYG